MEKVEELEKRIGMLEEAFQQLLRAINEAIQGAAPGLGSDYRTLKALDGLSKDLAGISRKVVTPRR